MARSRNIKPSIMDNEELAELEPLARLLFIYLWMLADRDGRLEDRPKRIAAQALPYDRHADVGAMLDQLHKAGFIVRYEAAGKACIQIAAFTKHQNPHVREAASTLPTPEQGTTKAVTKHNLGSAEASPRSPDSGFLIPDSLIPDCGLGASTPAAQAPTAKPASKRSRKTALPDDFGISDRVREWAGERGFNRLDEHLDAFKRKAIAKGYAYASWDDAFMEAIREDWAKLRNSPRGNAPQAMSFAERDELARRKRWEEMTGRKWPTEGDEFAGETIDTNTLEIGHEPADQSH